MTMDQWHGSEISRRSAGSSHIKIITIRDLIKYTLERDSIIEKGERVKLPTDKGDFEFVPFRQTSNGLEQAALVKGTWSKEEPLLVRLHSSCFTGDIFGSMRCAWRAFLDDESRIE